MGVSGAAFFEALRRGVRADLDLGVLLRMNHEMIINEMTRRRKKVETGRDRARSPKIGESSPHINRYATEPYQSLPPLLKMRARRDPLYECYGEESRQVSD